MYPCAHCSGGSSDVGDPTMVRCAAADCLTTAHIRCIPTPSARVTCVADVEVTPDDRVVLTRPSEYTGDDGDWRCVEHTSPLRSAAWAERERFHRSRLFGGDVEVDADDWRAALRATMQTYVAGQRVDADLPTMRRVLYVLLRFNNRDGFTDRPWRDRVESFLLRSSMLLRAGMAGRVLAALDAEAAGAKRAQSPADDETVSERRMVLSKVYGTGLEDYSSDCSIYVFSAKTCAPWLRWFRRSRVEGLPTFLGARSAGGSGSSLPRGIDRIHAGHTLILYRTGSAGVDPGVFGYVTVGTCASGHVLLDNHHGHVKIFDGSSEEKDLLRFNRFMIPVVDVRMLSDKDLDDPRGVLATTLLRSAIRSPDQRSLIGALIRVQADLAPARNCQATALLRLLHRHCVDDIARHATRPEPVRKRPRAIAAV